MTAARLLNTVYAVRVQNMDEKARTSFDRELDRIAVQARLAAANPDRRRRSRPGRLVPAAGGEVIETGRYRKIAPPGFTPEEMDRDAQNVLAYMGQTQGKR